MYGGVNYEEFDKDFGYQNTASYDHATRDVLSGSTDYISFKAFPESKIYEYLLTQFMFYDRVTCKVRDLEINTRDWNYTQLKHQQ